MAMHDFAVCVHNRSNLPRDDSINILHYEVNAPETVVGVMDDIAAAYVGLASFINSQFLNITIKAYNPGPGPPTDTKNYGAFFSAAEGPTEVALCLSYSADDNVTGTPRRRGRIYLPLAGAFARPTSGVINGLLDFGEALASVGTAGNTTWFMRSVVDNAYKKIESISVDNEWDTQRRRGMRSTARTRRDVQ